MNIQPKKQAEQNELKNEKLRSLREKDIAGGLPAQKFEIRFNFLAVFFKL
jgi:hypothetical protein